MGRIGRFEDIETWQNDIMETGKTTCIFMNASFIKDSTTSITAIGIYKCHPQYSLYNMFTT